MLRRVDAVSAEPIAAFVGGLERRLDPRLDDAGLQAILAETEAHLRQAAEELVELGVSPHDAERAAVAAFGKPRFSSPPSRFAAGLAAGLAGASGGAAFVLALTSLDDFKPGSPAGFPLVAAVVGLPLLLFAALGRRGVAPRVRPLAPTFLAGVAILLVGLPSQFVVSARSGNDRAILPLLDDPFYVRASPKELRATNVGFARSSPRHGEASLTEPYPSRLVRMAPWSVALPTTWALLSFGAQTAGYGLFLASRARRRRPTVA